MKVYIFYVFSCIFIAYCKGQTIANGVPVNITEYPYATSLQYSPSGSVVNTCGGIILSTTALLSAASCFYTNNIAHGQNEWANWQARVGSSFASTNGEIYSIRLITQHPNFTLLSKDNNIAVLRTASNIVLVPGLVEVGRIAGGAFTIEARSEITAIGWGIAEGVSSTDELHHVSAFVIDQDVCALRYQEIDVTVTNNMICFGWLDVGVVGQCIQEGVGPGSPLVLNGGVVGIHSTAEGCASLRYPSINTRTSPYWRWIVETANASQ